MVIIKRFFPEFISSIPGLNLDATEELKALELSTPNKLTTTCDETLLGIKGICPSKLLKICAFCASSTENRGSDRELCNSRMRHQAPELVSLCFLTICTPKKKRVGTLIKRGYRMVTFSREGKSPSFWNFLNH